LSLVLVIGLLGVLALPVSVFGRPWLQGGAGAIGIVCTNGPSFSLQTATGYIYTPDGNALFMWGYTANGLFQMPGPILCVNQGQTVTITLTNPTAAGGGPGENVSIIFPGQASVTASGGVAGLLTNEAAPGGSVTYSFTAGEPGTYLYESGTNPHKQVQMGLYGALIVRPILGANYAYNDLSTQFNPSREFLILLHEIDPTLHRAVERGQPYDVTLLNFDYWTVNGRAFPDTISENGAPWLPSQPYGALVQVEPYDPTANALPALIRYANAGMDNHPFHPHGNHLRVIARDGRLLRGPGGEDTSFEDFSRTIGSGQTYDLLFRWDDVDPWIAAGGTPEPVVIPGLQNLVFKDGVTFYSGDPELGEQGELPVGVTSFNQCGEYYFPWHSHALFEFTNFDEGFGGMATLLRVDPPGGCP
jgi:FtsP/CotA-like multicopper oxidase with cupredoxin domain